MSLTQLQQKRLDKLAKIEKAIQGDVIGVFEHIDTVESELNDNIKDIKDTVDNLDIPERLTKEELKAIIEPLIPDPVKGDDGDSYILTEQDKSDIASKIDVPVVDKVIEKTIEKVEVRIEQPIEIIKEVAVLDPNTLPQYGDKFRDGLELLQEDERLDKSAIKGLEDYQEVSTLAKASRFINRGGNGKGLFSQQNDVSITDPTTGQVPVYNETTQKWENGPAGATSPLTTKGDLYGYSTVDSRVPVGVDGQILTADSSKPNGINWEYPQTAGILTYYWTPTASDVATYYKSSDIPYPPLSTATYTAVTNGQLLRTYITELDNPNLLFIPDGQYLAHIHANVVTTGGKKDTYLRAEVWETTSAGIDIAKIANLGSSIILTSINAEYFIADAILQYTLASASSRVAIKIYAVISGTGGQPDVQIHVGDGSDSRLSFPSTTVSINNFVPYSGATHDLDMTGKTITADSFVGSGASLTGVVKSIVAGTNVTVDNTDPQNPIINTTGGGGTSGQATVNFGANTQEDSYATVTVSSTSVTSSSKIFITPAGVATSDHESDDYQWDNISGYVSNIVNGVSFDIIGVAPNGSFGNYIFNYLIN